MRKIFLLIALTSNAAQADFWDDWRACTKEPGIFIGIEPSELVRNDLKQFTGEIGYKFNDEFHVRLTMMNFKAGNSNFIGDYGSDVVTGGM